MWASLVREVSNLTAGDEGRLHFDLAAERIQHALLDVSLPRVDGLDLGAHAEPARLVGGDYIDVFSLTGQTLVFGLGDASGKSLAAALNAMMLRYLVRGLVRALGHEQIEAILNHVNAVVTEDLRDGDQFITLVLGAIDARSGALTVANAGHEAPLLLRAGSSEVTTIPEHDIVLGVDHAVRYKALETVLNVGDRAVFYTDGLTEATNQRGELFTVARLSEAFLAHRDLGAQELADMLFEDVKTYAGHTMRDDATLFVIRRTGDPQLI